MNILNKEFYIFLLTVRFILKIYDGDSDDVDKGKVIENKTTRHPVREVNYYKKV